MRPDPTESFDAPTRRALGAYLKLCAQTAGVTQTCLARDAALERSVVSRVWCGKVVRPRDYERVCEALDLDFDEALERSALVSREIPQAQTASTAAHAKTPRRSVDMDTPRPTRILTVCAEKGGVGKTTTAVTLAFNFMDEGKRVLLIDLDAQANATAWVLGNYDVDDDGGTLLEAIKGRAPLPVRETERGVHLVAAGREMASAPSALQSQIAGHKRLAKLCAPLRGAYDYIILDTPPTLGPLTVAALCAADFALLPARTDGFSLDAMERTLGTCREVRADLNERLEILGCVIVDYDRRLVVSRELVRMLSELDGLQVMEPYISTCVRFKEATTVREPITLYAPEHQATREFARLARRIDAACAEVA